MVHDIFIKLYTLCVKLVLICVIVIIIFFDIVSLVLSKLYDLFIWLISHVMRNIKLHMHHETDVYQEQTHRKHIM